MSRLEYFLCNSGRPLRSPRPVSFENMCKYWMLREKITLDFSPLKRCNFRISFQVQQIEVNLMSALEPLKAEKIDFGDHSVTRHPEFIEPEVRMLRLHSVAGSDFQMELFSVEWYVPKNSRSCIQDGRQLLRARHMANVGS